MGETGQERGLGGSGAGAPNAEAEIARVVTLARWLDDRFLDPLLGLVLPGVGDAAGALVGLYAVRVAARLRLPRVVIARMLLNLAVDALLGSVPVVGELFDFVHKAHSRNADLLMSRGQSREARPSDTLILAGAALLFLGALLLPLVLVVGLLRALF